MEYIMMKFKVKIRKNKLYPVIRVGMNFKYGCGGYHGAVIGITDGIMTIFDSLHGAHVPIEMDRALLHIKDGFWHSITYDDKD